MSSLTITYQVFYNRTLCFLFPSRIRQFYAEGNCGFDCDNNGNIRELGETGETECNLKTSNIH